MVELRSNNIGRRSSSAAASTTRSNRIGGSSSRLSHSSQLIPMLRYFSLYLLFLAFSAQSVANGHNHSKHLAGHASQLYAAIYYGDSEVDVGDPFSITCRIAIDEPTQWIKDKELLNGLTGHRHGHAPRDDYVFSVTEAEDDERTQLVTISSSYAQPHHEGNYRCNALHPTTHRLRVRKVAHKHNNSVTSYHHKGSYSSHVNAHALGGQLIESNIDDPPIEYRTTVAEPIHHSKGFHNHPSDSNHHNSNTTSILVGGRPDVSEEFMPTEVYTPARSHPNVATGLDADQDLSLSAEHQVLGADGEPWLNPVVRNSAYDPELFVTIADSNLDEAGHLTSVAATKHKAHLHRQMHLNRDAMNSPVCLACLALHVGDIDSGEVTSADGVRKLEQLLEIPSTPTSAISVAVIPHSAKTSSSDFPPSGSAGAKGTPPMKTMENKNKAASTQAKSSTATDAFLNSFSVYDDKSMASAELKPNYDNIEKELKVFDDRDNKPLTLSCDITETGDFKLSWTRNSIDVSEDPILKGRYTIVDNTFTIAKPDDKDGGLYECSVPQKWSRKINVVANVYFKHMSESLAVVEGEKLTVKCKVFGTNPEISWIVGNTTIPGSTDRIILSPDDDQIKNAVLTINAAELDDRAQYNCTATNDAVRFGNKNYEVATEGVYIRVKGKLAALWPFLGICAEVFILCAIILVYEKRRNKAEMDESDTDQSPEQKKKRIARDYD